MTNHIKSIILNRRPFRERDVLVTVYSEEQGKLELVARGARKFESKLAGHIEPISFVEIMAIKGKNQNYLGFADTNNQCLGIKNDYEKIMKVGSCLNVFSSLVKENEKDQELFELLSQYLAALNSGEAFDFQLYSDLFLIKSIGILGYAPDLYHCHNCGQDVDGFKWDVNNGGMICCGQNASKLLTISEKSVNLLHQVFKQDLYKLANIKLDIGSKNELASIKESLVRANLH